MSVFAVTYKTGFFQVPENLPSALQVRISCFYVFFFLFWSRASEGKGYVPFEVYLKSKGAIPLPRSGGGGREERYSLIWPIQGFDAG